MKPFLALTLAAFLLGAGFVLPVFSQASTALSGYDRLLKTHVNPAGLVDYRAMAKDRASLDAYTSYLAALPPATYASWSEPEKMAMWINAYNAYTLAAILDAYPIKRTTFVHPKNSIRQIKGVWDRTPRTVMGNGITLDAMEHQRLRKDWKEPRIHMAIVCASIGCPVLRPEAFRGDKLETQLAEQTRAFFQNRRNFIAEPKKNTVHLSKLFEWFSEDFGNIADFAAPYVGPETASFMKRGGYKTKYIKYDWSLNEQ